MNYGTIWPNSRLTARKARKEYTCDTPDCGTEIRKGDAYYVEFRGGIDSIRRCACCVERHKAAA